MSYGLLCLKLNSLSFQFVLKTSYGEGDQMAHRIDGVCHNILDEIVTPFVFIQYTFNLSTFFYFPGTV